MDHKEMNVWKKSMDLVEEIYKLSSHFPREELYGLTSQMRRAALSIPSNIAEGAGRKGDKEFIQFISVAIGSLSELETQYLLAIRLNFTKEDNELSESIEAVRKLLIGTRKYLTNKK